MPKSGIVYIVGAGPGDPDLITVRGLKYLRQADVVVYDRLVNRQLLDEAPLWAEYIYVGKEPGHHAFTQTEINTILIREAGQGKVVVRLKGGDPFVFGRGGEECQALAEADVPFQVVPGITSAISVPAYAGIPVTQRGYANAFAVVTGHTAGPDTCAIDWEALPQSGTLVILMGVRNLPQITQQLIAHGRGPETPAAVISQGTTRDQVTITGTLADIAGKAQGVQPPATIVVGEVVGLSHQLAWFDPPEQELAPMLLVPRSEMALLAAANE